MCDKQVNSLRLTSSEDEGQEELKGSFLYRSSQSPPKKKKTKKDKTAKKEDK